VTATEKLHLLIIGSPFRLWLRIHDNNVDNNNSWHITHKTNSVNTYPQYVGPFKICVEVSNLLIIENIKIFKFLKSIFYFNNNTLKSDKNFIQFDLDCKEICDVFLNEVLSLVVNLSTNIIFDQIRTHIVNNLPLM
jgi:hypothetical protein